MRSRAALRALVRASRRATASQATVRLAVTAPAVLRVLNLVGIDRMIEVHPSVTAALASLHHRGDLVAHVGGLGGRDQGVQLAQIDGSRSVAFERDGDLEVGPSREGLAGDRGPGGATTLDHVDQTVGPGAAGTLQEVSRAAQSLTPKMRKRLSPS